MDPRLDHSIIAYPASCARCGKPHGMLAADCAVLCREGCLRAELEDPEGRNHDPRRFEKGEAGTLEKPALVRASQGEPHEHRRVICGQCMRPVGQVEMRDKGPSPAVFHRGECWDAYVEAGKRDPRGAMPGR